MAQDLLKNDVALLKQLREGSQEGLKAIFNSYYNYLCTIAYRYVGDEHLAKDLSQEVFFELWKRRKELQINTSLKFYLRRAVINKSLNHLKSKRVQFEEADAYTHLPANIDQKDVQMEADDLQTTIQNTINRLPERCRVIFALSRNEGLSHKQIAAQLGISTKTIENQISKALKLLREAIKPHV